MPTISDGPVVEIGEFVSTYDSKIVRDILLIGVRSEVSGVGDSVTEAPIIRTHYLSESADDRLVVSAGNRIETDHAMIVELQTEGNGTRGHLYFSNKPKIWSKDAVGMVTGIERALKASSAPSVAFDSDYISLLMR